MKSTILNWKFFRITLLWTVLLGGVLTSCDKDDDDDTTPATDKVALQAAIATAQNLVNTTAEGTQPGEYVVGSQAALIAALAASNAVNSNPNATQAAINNATQQLLAAIATYQTNYIDEIAAANLIGYWKMNGNPNDSSGNNHNGVVTAGHAYYGAGTPTLTADRFNRANMAYHFDKGGNLEIPYSTALNPQSMSISLWVKWSGAGRTINPDTYTFLAMNRWNGYKFQLQGGHLPFYTVKVLRGPGDTTIYDRDDAGIAVAEDTWRHLVVTFTSGTMSFYIDGDLVKTWDSSTPNPVPGTALTLPTPINFVIGQDLPTNKYLTVDGDFQVAWGGFFTGAMDDVMFYNVALTAPQVQSIFINQNTL
jgi:Concanavalin A-like lectin/glucanases superfamily